VDPQVIPEQRLSSQVMEADFMAPDDEPFLPLKDYEYGGTNLNDPTAGLRVKIWTLEYDTPDFLIYATGVSPVSLFQRTGVTQVALAFDQNMRPCVAYVQDGQAWLYWYDTLVASFVFTALATGILDPRLCLDDKRVRQSGTSDIILAYTLNNNLYFRAQRDRFGVQYLLRSGVDATLKKVGMNTKFRLQFQLEAIT
jgi:hypothetical protein